MLRHAWHDTLCTQVQVPVPKYIPDILGVLHFRSTTPAVVQPLLLAQHRDIALGCGPAWQLPCSSCSTAIPAHMMHVGIAQALGMRAGLAPSESMHVWSTAGTSCACGVFMGFPCTPFLHAGDL